MIVFVDTKSSFVEIIQNIGRVCRKNENTKQLATILLPIMVNVDKYKDCKNDVDRDTVIRNEMSNSGDFNGILNVISALRQEDPYLFEMCLKYPNVFCDKEINDNVVKHGLKVDNNIVSKDKLFNDYGLNYDDNISEINNFDVLSKKIQRNIQVISDKVDEKDIVINNKFDKIKHFIKKEDNFKIVIGDGKDVVSKVNRNIKPNVHVCNEISVLWKFENDIMVDKTIFGGYIKAVTMLEDEEEWVRKLDLVKDYIRVNEKRPSGNDKDKNIKILGQWLSNQLRCYKKLVGKMKIIKIRELWKSFISDNLKYFESNINIWKNTLKKVINYIRENNKLPSQHDKNNDIKALGQWIGTQKKNYKKQTKFMKGKEIYDIFTQFLKDNGELCYDNNTKWKNTLEKVKDYIKKNNKLPSSTDKNNDTKALGQWISDQKSNYKKQINIMKEKEIHDIFTQFLKDNEQLFYDNNTIWKNTLEQIKNYIKEHNKLPNKRDKNNDIKVLGSWISTQKTIYKKQTYIMKEKEIYDIFTEFLKDNEQLFYDNNTIWKNTLEKVKNYINEHNKLPSEYNKNNDTKVFGKWISTQKQNYKKQLQIMKEQEIRLLWEEFATQYLSENIIITDENIKQPEIQEVTEQISKPKRIIRKKTTIEPSSQNTTQETTKNNHQLSNYQEISKKLSIQNSNTTHKMFKTNQTLWHDYHNSRDFSFQGYDNQQEIPVNKIINYLTKKTSRKLTILDLGCGRNIIKTTLSNYPSLNIIGYDHISFNDSIECDISKLPNENESVDICVFSQSLMGSNWKEYLEEAIRVLRYNGEIIISESVERYDIIKKFIIDKGLIIKNDDYVIGNRWFYLYVLNDVEL